MIITKRMISNVRLGGCRTPVYKILEGMDVMNLKRSDFKIIRERLIAYYYKHGPEKRYKSKKAKLTCARIGAQADIEWVLWKVGTIILGIDSDKFRKMELSSRPGFNGFWDLYKKVMEFNRKER